MNNRAWRRIPLYRLNWTRGNAYVQQIPNGLLHIASAKVIRCPVFDLPLLMRQPTNVHLRVVVDAWLCEIPTRCDVTVHRFLFISFALRFIFPRKMQCYLFIYLLFITNGRTFAPDCNAFGKRRVRGQRSTERKAQPTC